MIEAIVNYLTGLVTTLGYPGVVIAMFVESFFAPIPSELIMPLAGFIAATGEMNLYIVIVLGGVASYLGSLPFYFLGYYTDEKFVKRMTEKFGKFLFISVDDVTHAYDFFRKKGNILVLVGRVIPIVRTLISFPAGSARMNFAIFTLYTLIGSITWSAILTVSGYLLGENWETVKTYTAQYEHIVMYLGILFVFGVIVWKVREHFKKRIK